MKRKIIKRLLSLSAAVLLLLSLVACSQPGGGGGNGDSPRSGGILFTSDRDGDDEIWVMNADGTNVRQLTNNSGANSDDTHPSWSYDGTKIAFVSNREAGTYKIFTMNADGTGVSVGLATVSGVVDGGFPAWSADGSKIAYVNAYSIYTINSDGTGNSQLTNTTLDDELHPAWSPDGTQLVFSGRASAGDYEIYRGPSSGGPYTDYSLFTALTANTKIDDAPCWSPDGTTIVFSSDRDGGSGGNGDREIWVMDADGSNPTQLTDTGSTLDDTYPSYSPDGTQITFATDRDTNWEIYTMSSAGASPTAPASDAAKDEFPSW